MSSDLVVAIDPVESSFNSFVARFAEAVAAGGARVVPYAPELRPLLGANAVIIHWPALFMGATSRRKALHQLARFRLARLIHGTRLIWVAHNVAQHDGGGRHRFIPETFIRSLDGIIYLSERSREIVRDAYPIARRTVELVTVHGAYDRGLPPRAFVSPQAGEPVRLVSFGLVRRYKHLDELVAAAAPLDAGAITVTLVGKRHDAAYADELAAMTPAGGTVRLAFQDDLLDEPDIETAIDAAHGAVLPYRNILNSGSAIHALSRGRPVLLPALGSMPELQAQIGEKWVRLYEGALTPSVLDAFADHVRGIETGASPDLSALAWTRVEQDLASLFRRLELVR